MAVDGWQLCSNWIPLDPITEETALEFVRGSHRWNRWFAPFDSMRDGTRHPSKVFERMSDIEASRGDYDIVWFELEPGDCLFAFTDGLVEARSPSGEAFGAERLRHTLRANSTDPGKLVRGVMDALDAFTGQAEPHDDVTLLAATRVIN